jgi:hypothetical protein
MESINFLRSEMYSEQGRCGNIPHIGIDLEASTLMEALTTTLGFRSDRLLAFSTLSINKHDTVTKPGRLPLILLTSNQ